MVSRDINVHITGGSIFTALLFILLAAILWYLMDVVLIVITAVVIASAMEPAVRFFMRRGLHRILAVIAIYAVVAAIFFGTLIFFVPPILNDAANFIAKLPETIQSLNITDVTGGLLPWGRVGQDISFAELLRGVSSTLAETTGGVFTTLSALFGGVTSFVLIVVFSFYFSVQETGVDDFLRVVTPVKEQAYVL